MRRRRVSLWIRLQPGYRRSWVPKFFALYVLFGALLLWAAPVQAGNQQYEPLARDVQVALAQSIADRKPPRMQFGNAEEKIAYLNWLAEMSERLQRRTPDYTNRKELLETVYYESKRSGLDPAMVLGLVQVESGFKKYALSNAGARGYMQVMPFWTTQIGDGDTHKLFNLRSNLRYGCTILRHYLDIERGNVFRALGRYNGSLGQAEYPNRVLGAWKQWEYPPVQTLASGK
ncbi:MAG: lytic transglycosylase domain-containing protein [Burkholderiaceae bacterium]|nr:MAG: lytic transglycosylase domain-containing protein [Burkholderiaceae bacterium]